MRVSSNDPLVAATARLLSAQPQLSNLELVQRLARMLGEDVVRRVPVNRFQRQVRDPALNLIRAGAANGTAARMEGPSASTAAEPAHRTGWENPTRMAERSPARPQVSPWVVDEALLEAFVLGGSCERNADGIDAFRRLDELRRRLRDRLGNDS